LRLAGILTVLDVEIQGPDPSTMAAAFGVFGGREITFRRRVRGSGFSGGVSLKSSIHWQPEFCETLPAGACPAASTKIDGLCLS
jgi:hypothetical protein